MAQQTVSFNSDVLHPFWPTIASSVTVRISALETGFAQPLGMLNGERHGAAIVPVTPEGEPGSIGWFRAKKSH
jgi:hypothetical protein